MSIITHHNISDLYKSLDLPIIQELDFTIHFLPDIHPIVPFKSPVFRSEYFSFLFIKDSKGRYTTDDNVFNFKPYTIFFTNPGHVKSFEIEESKNAFLITFTESFLRENVHPDIFEEFPFLLTEIVPPMTMNEKEYKEFEDIYIQLYREFNKSSCYKKQILGNLFVVLLLKIKEKFWLSYNPIEEGDRNSQITKSFKQLLEKKFTSLTVRDKEYNYRVLDYARDLNLHPNYLNDVIKSKTGKTVNQWICERMVSIAKVMLKNTKLSLKEIGYRLGYSDPTHFSRFFKKNTQLSPGNYRKKY